MNPTEDKNIELNDAAARAEALDPHQSFIVSAPAGSGKTGLITQRLLKLLGLVDNPEEILCITFTRKAAAEMRHRIHSALADASENPRPTEYFEAHTWDLATKALARNSTLDWNLLDIPYRLRIKTIDSFCHYVAKQFMFDKGSGSLPEQSEYPDNFYQMATRELLKRLEEKSATGKALTIIVAHMGNDLQRCEKLFSDMLSKRDQWLPYIYTAGDNSEYFQQVIERLAIASLNNIQQQLMPLRGELLEMADYAATNASSENSGLTALKGISDLPEPNQSNLKQWKTLLQMLVKKDKDYSPRKTVTKKEGFPKENKEQKARMISLLNDYRNDHKLQALLLDVMHLPEQEISLEQQEILNALGLLLPQLAAILNIIFQQKGQSDYSAITMAALQALEPDPQQETISDITLQLDYQIKHILVDEFQDTSGSQIKLLEHLVAGWEYNDGRTLFLVGDAMQSLYSFRDARVGLFINAQNNPIGPVQCIPLALTSNFRSNKGIVDWVNQCFEVAFPVDANINRGAVPYNQSTSVKPAKEEQAVFFHGYSSKEISHYNQSESSDIAKLCESISQESPQESIAILVRNRGHLKQIVPALIDAKLSWEAVDIDPLADRMPVIDVMSITRALLSPADRIAWLSVLRAPFCGLNLKDLVILTNGIESVGTTPDCLLERLHQWQQYPHYFSEISSQGNQTLARVAPIIIKAWQQRNIDSLRTLVETLWMELGGAACLLHERDIYDIRRYLDLLESSQEAGTINNWKEFKKAVDNLYALPVNKAHKESLNAIQIMTIHKAKGLEFDHVILPGLTKSPRSDDNPLLRWQEQVDEYNDSSLLLAALGPYDEDNDPIYSYLKYEQSIRTTLENTRVLYVAATRAVRQLHLFGQLKENKEGWQKPSKSTLLAPIWPTLKDHIEQPGYEVTKLDSSELLLSQLMEIQPTQNYYRRLASTHEAVTMPSKMMTLGIGKRIKNNNNSDAIDTRSRHLGTTLHRTLKQIVSEGLENWPLDRREQLPFHWASTLKQYGIIVTKAELDSLINGIETMLDDSRGKWILSQHKDNQCEQALAYFDKETQRVKTSVIDRSFIDNNIRWIIDYKFSKPTEGETENSFIQRQITSYQSQLKHYAQLYKQLETKTTRCALYYPQTAVFIELTGN